MNRIKLSDIKWLLVLLCLPFVSSCKDDLEAYEEAEITSVGAYHRYYTTEKDALTGEFKVAEKELEKSNSINEDEAVVTATFTVPAASGSFTDAERAKVSLNKCILQCVYCCTRDTTGWLPEVRGSGRLDLRT